MARVLSFLDKLDFVSMCGGHRAGLQMKALPNNNAHPCQLATYTSTECSLARTTARRLKQWTGFQQSSPAPCTITLWTKRKGQLLTKCSLLVTPKCIRFEHARPRWLPTLHVHDYKQNRTYVLHESRLGHRSLHSTHTPSILTRTHAHCSLWEDRPLTPVSARLVKHGTARYTVGELGSHQRGAIVRNVLKERPGGREGQV